MHRPILTRAPRNQTALIGSNVSMVCEVLSNAHRHLEWYHGYHISFDTVNKTNQSLRVEVKVGAHSIFLLLLLPPPPFLFFFFTFSSAHIFSGLFPATISLPLSNTTAAYSSNIYVIELYIPCMRLSTCCVYVCVFFPQMQ